MSKNSIRVILADDHDMIRRGIRRILEKSSNICVVGEASTGAGALHLVEELEPDVLLLDLEMSDMKGIQVARELRKRHARVSIVILSACDESNFIDEILRAGADGYIAKSEPPSRLREVITRVSEKYAVALASLILVLLPPIGLGVLYGAIMPPLNFF